MKEISLTETAAVMATEVKIPNGCFYKDFNDKLYFLWIIDGEIPAGSVAIPFGESDTKEQHLKDLDTKHLQLVHAVICPKDGVDPKNLSFDKYSDFKKVDFYVDFRESILLTRDDMSPVTTTDVMMEGGEILLNVVKRHMKSYL